MIEIEKIETDLVLKYYSDLEPSNWLDKKLNSDESFIMKNVFSLNKNTLIERVEHDSEEPEFFFRIGKLLGNYYNIDKDVLGLKNDFYFFKDLDFDIDFFVAGTKISLLKKIDNNLKQAFYVGGEIEDSLPIEEFLNLIKIFPNTHEINLYRDSKITSIINNYFDNIPDKELQYNKYLKKKLPAFKSKLRKTFKESEIVKYETLLGKLKFMLNNEINYNEHEWQEEILQIILLLFPKYIAVFKEVGFKDIYNNKNRRLDYGLIDFMGNLDIIEIKIPSENNIVSKRQHRDNHVPNRDLSVAIMQIEKYIYYLNKLGIKGEKELTEKYKSELPPNLEIKIINPNGMIIMGRDIKLEKTQLSDFEIIKRKFKNIIDIFTYDDLLRRLEITIEQLKKI